MSLDIEFVNNTDNKDNYELLLKTYGLTTLYQRRTEHLLLFIYKKSKSDNKFLDQQRPKMELRSRNKVKIKYPFTNKAKVQNSPLYRCIFLWNQLSPDIQNIDAINEFKKTVRELIESGRIKYERGKA